MAKGLTLYCKFTLQESNISNIFCHNFNVYNFSFNTYNNIFKHSIFKFDRKDPNYVIRKNSIFFVTFETFRMDPIMPAPPPSPTDGTADANVAEEILQVLIMHHLVNLGWSPKSKPGNQDTQILQNQACRAAFETFSASNCRLIHKPLNHLLLQVNLYKKNNKFKFSHKL